MKKNGNVKIASKARLEKVFRVTEHCKKKKKIKTQLNVS